MRVRLIAAPVLCLLLLSCSAGRLRLSDEELLPDGTVLVFAEYQTGTKAGRGVEATITIPYRCSRPDLEVPGECRELSTPIIATGKTLAAGMLTGAGTVALGGAALVGAAYLHRPDQTTIDDSTTVAQEGGTLTAGGDTMHTELATQVATELAVQQGTQVHQATQVQQAQTSQQAVTRPTAVAASKAPRQPARPPGQRATTTQHQILVHP